MGRRVLIVGGVAGGANAAARLRRLDEGAEITIFERGPYVSFANCGLPYHIGGEIEDRGRLLVHTPDSLTSRFNIHVHVGTEVTSIDPLKQTVTYRHLASGTEGSAVYDDLILATGAAPVRPPIPGIASDGIFVLRDITDMDQIIGWIREKKPRSAIVVGGGFIGLEMLEQLHRLGLSLTVVEAGGQVLHQLDPELAVLAAFELERQGIQVVLSDPVKEFVPGAAAKLLARTQSGRELPADLVIFGIGVRPETGLAKSCGIELGKTGGIAVNRLLQTSVPHIWAVGDCIEVTHFVSGEPVLIPLAGPANRQGRMVADNICGRQQEYSGTLGTAIVRIFSLTAAVTGLNEKAVKKLGVPYQAINLHPLSHAGYYPGATRMSLKIIFEPESGKILGAQIVGKDGVDKRIDVLATAIMAGLTVDALSELELSYAPPYGSAKDPVNLAGMIGQNVRRKLVSLAQWDNLPDGAVLIDVREPAEFSRGAIPGAKNIPLGQLRARYQEIPKRKTVVTYCQSGQRSYNAARILSQHGIEALNLSGAFNTWCAANKFCRE